MNPAPLRAHLGFWLRSVSNHVSLSFARRLEAHEVTVAEWVLMRELYDHVHLTPSELAEAMGMTRGAISKLAERLLAKALIAREDDPDDRRSHRLSLTPRGRALVPVMAALADQNDAACFDVLDPAVRQGLESALRALASAHSLTTPPLG